MNPEWIDSFQVVYLSALRAGEGWRHGVTSLPWWRESNNAPRMRRYLPAPRWGMTHKMRKGIFCYIRDHEKGKAGQTVIGRDSPWAGSGTLLQPLKWEHSLNLHRGMIGVVIRPPYACAASPSAPSPQKGIQRQSLFVLTANSIVIFIPFLPCLFHPERPRLTLDANKHFSANIFPLRRISSTETAPR